MDSAREDYRKDVKFEQIVPSSWWVPSSDPYCLRLHLPGFKKEDNVRLRYGSLDHIIVSGEREETNKVIRFEQSFKVPNDSNIEEASGNFEGNVFYVSIPKKVVPKEEGRQKSAYEQGEHQKSDRADNVSSDEEQSNAVKKILEKVVKNRGAVLTGIVAFSLGVLVSFHYQKKGKGKRVAIEVPKPINLPIEYP